MLVLATLLGLRLVGLNEKRTPPEERSPDPCRPPAESYFRAGQVQSGRRFRRPAEVGALTAGVHSCFCTPPWRGRTRPVSRRAGTTPDGFGCLASASLPG